MGDFQRRWVFDDFINKSHKQKSPDGANCSFILRGKDGERGFVMKRYFNMVSKYFTNETLRNFDI